jgi:hypothetical protein
MDLEVGVLLADRASLDEALEVAGAHQGAELFLMDDGVLAARDPRLLALYDDGAEVVLCATDAEAHGLQPSARGPRFGSQWDHACMIRDARELVTLTGGPARRSRPPENAAPRRVAVHLTREAGHPKTAQALRSAVGYAAAHLDVRVVVEPAAHALLDGDGHAPPIVRALAALRALGCAVATACAEDGAAACDVEVAW